MKKTKFTPLKRIANDKGDILHGIKVSDDDFSQFGEAYFSFVNHNEIKGWKKHTQMEMNLIVPVGDVKFHLYNDNHEYQSYRINEKNYGRLMVPAGYWMAFEGKGNGLNLVLNIASIEHEPDESIKEDIGKFDINET